MDIDADDIDREICRLADLVTEQRFPEALDFAASLSEQQLDNRQRHFVQSNRGAALHGLKRHAEAIEAFDVAMSLRAVSCDTAANIADCYLALGNFRTAMNYYNRAVALGASDPVVHYNRACMAALVGEHAELLVALRKAIELDEQNRADAADDPDFADVIGMPDVRELLHLPPH